MYSVMAVGIIVPQPLCH